MTRAIIYTRVSTEEQSREGVSLQHQESKCYAQASVHDWEVLGHHQDAGKSAKSLNREGIQEVIQLVKDKQVDTVIIYKLDRLTRSISDLDHLIQMFNKYNVALVSVQDSIDTSTASGRLVLHLLGTVSQWERETIAERTSNALQYKKKQGKKYTRIAPYGFRWTADNELELSDSEQQVIDRIISMREGGRSYQWIANQFNKNGVKTRFGRPWNQGTIAKLFKDNQFKEVA